MKLYACGNAMNALDDAGHSYELEVVPGYKAMPWTRRGDARTSSWPVSSRTSILALDDGTAIAGSSRIVEWAKSSPATT